MIYGTLIKRALCTWRMSFPLKMRNTSPQLARMLVGAELQQITYQEFLPIVLGSKALGNLAKTETSYDQNVDPSILNEFATVAFR